MIRFRRSLGLLLLPFALGGCVSIFPKAPPVQLYRFGAEPPATVTPAPGATSRGFNLLRATTQFNQASAGDRILTARGDEAAYVAGARWASPAAVLFDESLDRAIDASGGPARRVERGGLASAQVEMKLNVETFEARYAPGASTPTVEIRVHGELLHLTDRRLVSARDFVANSPADADRVSAIVRAFDAATADVQGQIVGWVNGQPASATGGP